mgnify:CR=1 FL=1
MSRQARIESDIVVKNADTLKEAVELTCKELGAVKIKSIRYYAGKVEAGIKMGNAEVGIVVDSDGKLSFVGEDYTLNSEAGQKIRQALVKNYKSLSFVNIFNRMGYKTTLTQGVKNFVMGVRA